MSEDWANKITKKIRSEQSELKADKDSRRLLNEERPKLWEEFQARLREKANAVHERLGQSYFEITGNADPEGAVRVKSPKGQIEINILGPLNIVNVLRVNPEPVGDDKRTLEKTFQLELRDNGIWLRVQDANLSAGDLAEYALDLIA